MNFESTNSKGYPPIMSDGRMFSSWQPNSEINEQLRKEANITSNWHYRQYLTKYATDIMESNQLSICNSCSASPGYLNTNKTSKNVPFLFKSCLDNSTPDGFESSDLKTEYLTRQQLNARLAAPILPQSEYLNQQYPRSN